MNNEKDYVVTLDNDKKYIVVDSINYDNKIYLYLTEMDDKNKYMIGELDNEDLIEIEDKNLLGKLLLEFAKNEN